MKLASFALICSLLSVVGGCSSKEEDVTTRTGTPIATLLAEAPRPIEIDYSFHDVFLGEGREGRFVWRQASGLRRLDSTVSVEVPAAIGHFALFSDDWHSDLLYCSWNSRPRQNDFFVNCSTGVRNAAGIDDIVDVLSTNSVSRQLANRDIAGRTANCYELTDGADGVICVDGVLKLPLLLELQCKDGVTCLSIAATSVHLNPQDIDAPPIMLVPNAVAGISQGDGTAQSADLNVPDYILAPP